MIMRVETASGDIAGIGSNVAINPSYLRNTAYSEGHDPVLGRVIEMLALASGEDTDEVLVLVQMFRTEPKVLMLPYKMPRVSAPPPMEDVLAVHARVSDG